MNQLQAMRVFIRVADLSSFSLAGKQLGMSGAAVTRSIGMLEAHLGMRLMNSSPRSLSLTEAGRLYLDGCRNVIDKLDEVESDLVRTTRAPSGILRIAAPSVFADHSLALLLQRYRAANPRVDFSITVYDAQVNLIEGGFDLSFTTDRYPANTTLISREVTSVRELAVASPKYLSQHGTPETPAELAGHELIGLSEGPRIWDFSRDGEAARRVNVNGPLSTSNYTMARAAALSDMGIALLPLPFVAEALAHGMLVSVLPDYEINSSVQRVSLVYPGRNYLSMKVRSFIDFAIDHFRTQTEDAPSRRIMATA